MVDGVSILLEAKRYDSRLPYHALAVKLQEALDRSGRQVEVWGAASTMAFDAHDAEDLRSYGRKNGVTVLLLDWSPNPLPPLATLLAAASDHVLGWFGTNAPLLTPAVSTGLDEVRARAGYDDLVEELGRELGRATLGLATARGRSEQWCLARFRQREMACRSFNQPLAPLDPSLRLAHVEREDLQRSMARSIATWFGDAPVVFVTGAPRVGREQRSDEGVGKSWAVAKAWTSVFGDSDRGRPLFLFMAAHDWRDGDELAPMRLLARLMARQTGTVGAESGTLDRWEVRLNLWLSGPRAVGDGPPVAIVVLDGVNERAGHPWSVLISALWELSRDRPIRIIVTTRRGFYERELAPRLRSVPTDVIQVEGLSDDGLDAALRKDGRDPSLIRDPLRGFLKNPRMLSVGMGLLDRLDPDQVGVERLLFEYLLARQEERAPRASHTAEQFGQTLVLHARELRDRATGDGSPKLQMSFDRSTMKTRLGLSPSGIDSAKDLDEVTDNRFLNVINHRNHYVVQSDTLSMALGLLIVDELDQTSDEQVGDMAATMSAILDPISSIDATSNLVLAAFELALAGSAKDCVAEELLYHLLTSRNMPDIGPGRVFSGLLDRPSVYLSVAERLFADPDGAGRHDWVVTALYGRRLDGRLRPMLDDAIRRWLGSYQPRPIEPEVASYEDGQREHVLHEHAKEVEAHDRGLSELKTAEAAYVRDMLAPLVAGRRHGVDLLATLLLPGRSLVPFAGAIFAWCVATAIGWGAGRARPQMRWLRRLAPTDWEETSTIVARLASDFTVSGASEVFHWAIQQALMDGGDPEQAMQADATWHLLHDGPRMIVWRAGDEVADEASLDPDIGRSSLDLEAIGRRYREWACAERRRDDFPPIMMRSGETMFARARAVLCRFDPEVAADVHRLLAREAPCMSGAAPVVVARSVVHDVAILGPAEVEALASWQERLTENPRPTVNDQSAIVTLLTAILPHMPADRQFDVLMRQHGDADDALWLGRLLKPLSSSDLRTRLDEAVSSGIAHRLRSALFFASETGAALNDIRAAVDVALTSDDDRVRMSALRTMVRLDDRRGMRDFTASGWAWSAGGAGQVEGFCASACLLRTLGGEDDPNLLDRLHPAVRSRALEIAGPKLASLMGNRIIAALNAFDATDLPPSGMDVSVVRWDGQESLRDLASVVHSLGFSPSGTALRPDGGRRRSRDREDFLSYAARLGRAGKDHVLYPLTSAAVDRLAVEAPATFERLLEGLEDLMGGHRDSASAQSAVTLAHDVARGLSVRDPVRAAGLFAGADRVTPCCPEVMPISHLPRTTLLLWQAADEPSIVGLRRDRLDDAVNDGDLAFEVLAAEMAGKHGHVVTYVRAGMASKHPAKIARAVTVAGFSRRDPALDEVFADRRLQHGFLGSVGSAAKKCYDGAAWAERWLRQAVAAEADLDVWRLGELALLHSDARVALYFEGIRGGDTFEMTRPLSRSGLEAAAARRTRDRTKTLFGEDPPCREILSRVGLHSSMRPAHPWRSPP